MFKSKEKEQKKQENIKRIKILGVFVFIFNILGCLFIFLNPKRWKKFLRGQKKEIKQLSEGKEDFRKFCHDSGKLIKDLFIPYGGNDHRPKSLRPKSLITYILIVFIVKLAVTSFLFITYPTPAELAAIISANMIALINDSRIEAGVEPLQENRYLAAFAEVKGQDMINRDYFAHDTPEGKKPWQWIERAEYDYVYAGENLAMDFTSAEVVHAAFLKSPTHRRNILNPKYKEVGIAVLNGKMNDQPTTLLVEFFATQRKDISTLAIAPAPTPEVEQLPTVPPATVNEPKTAGAAAGEVTPQSLESLTPEPANEGIIVVATTEKTSKALVDLVIEYSNIFFIAFLIFMLISLALDVFIKIKIQRPSVILQSIVVIALILAMILVKFHFVERVAPHLLIL